MAEKTPEEVALRCIKRAESERSTELDLSDLGLKILPAEIRKLSSLSCLYLARNQLRSLPPEIGKLRNLTELWLHGNRVSSLPAEIGNLTKLTTLNLSGNRLTRLAPELGELRKLTTLIVSGNQLSLLGPEIGELTNLTTLVLSRNKLTSLPPDIGHLTNVRELDVGHNRLTRLPAEIRGLTALRKLYLHANLLSWLPPEIRRLKRVSTLYLQDNALAALPPEIACLTGLRVLKLQSNDLDCLPAEIGRLPHLLELHLDGNRLCSLPTEIRGLSSLKVLRVQNNRLSSLPPVIGKVTNLTVLRAQDNAISTLPAEIGDLRKLRQLILTRNRLGSLPAEIGRLGKLAELSVAANELTSLPPEIGGLTALKSVYLHSNRLSSLPADIGRLSNLRLLELQGNQLASLPRELVELHDLTQLRLDGNPLADPPPEVIAQGTKAVLAYLRERFERGRQQWVGKLLVVGEGGVGKTCLLDALHGRPFDPRSETTHGIRLEPLELTHPSEQGVTMTLSTWDFGGQEIYHATHQFFLTNRSVFLLVWNARLGWKQGRLSYWLETIQALAPDSPVLLVAAHIDERTADLPYEDFKDKYPQLVGEFAISNKEPRRGIEELRDAMAAAAAELPLMGVEWPASWGEGADDVRTRPENRITAAELTETLADHGVKGEHQKFLVKALHELGDILYFDQDEELKDTVLLNPQWVTDRISRVLECEEIKQGEGIFRREHMAKVWTGLEPTTCERFLRLMEKFDLSYRIPEDPEDRSLVVERLSQDPGEYEPTWNAIQSAEGCKEISMKFDLGIARPAGVPTWFIARAHRFTTHTHWLYGALFADDRDEKKRKHLALLLAPPAEEDIVKLTVRGPSPYSFFTLLRDGLELTLRRFQGLRVKRTVPCPGKKDGEACPYEFAYRHLEERIEHVPPKLEIECPECYKEVSVPQLLFGIHWSTHDAVLARIDELEDEVLAGQEDIRVELHELRELTQREFTNLFNRDQRLEESHCPSIFSLRPVGRKKWPLVDKLFGHKWNLQLYCEYPGCWHPTQGAGEYEIKQPGKWLNALAPHLQRLIKVFKFVAPLAGPWLGYSAPEYEKLLKNDVSLMKGLVDSLSQIDVHAERELVGEYGLEDVGGRKRVEGASLRGLRKLLDKLDPSQDWGGLKKVLTPEGHYLWLCEYHAEEFRR